jgi:structural maintenance of chromosome 4
VSSTAILNWCIAGGASNSSLVSIDHRSTPVETYLSIAAMEGTTSNSKARLMISNMELENFKSYAGCQTIGPFHKRFSSIVGPNGSGKSNVIDALLFVFGKRAKQLRLNKVSELIHKSSGFPNLEYARVAVYFQLIIDDENSEDNYEVIPGSEFVVTRTAYLNNQSKYTIDGKNTTYNDVGQLLRGHGIDLDNNRFLILQGEVEQIAMMKPKGQTPQDEGLLEYLEDIIGSNRFVERIEAVSNKRSVLVR